MKIKDKKTDKEYDCIVFNGNNYDDTIAIIMSNGAIDFEMGDGEIVLFDKDKNKIIHKTKDKYIINKKDKDIEVLNEEEFNALYTEIL